MPVKNPGLDKRIQALIERAFAAAGGSRNRAEAAKELRRRLRRGKLIRPGVKSETVERHVRDALSEQEAHEKTGRCDGPDDVCAVLSRLLDRKLVVNPKG